MPRQGFKVVGGRCFDAHPESVVHLEATLNDLGKAGWTLVSSTTVMGGTWLSPHPVITAILKRERDSNGPEGLAT